MKAKNCNRFVCRPTRIFNTNSFQVDKHKIDKDIWKPKFTHYHLLQKINFFSINTSGFFQNDIFR